MSDGRSSIAFAAPAAGIRWPWEWRHYCCEYWTCGSISQQRDAGVDQTMGARASSRSRVPSAEEEGRTRIRKSRKGEKASSPRSADQQLDAELRKAQGKAEAQMNEAAEQLDENNALKKECASLQSSVDRQESGEAGSLEIRRAKSPLTFSS